jgi:hypothetical protein
MTAARLGLGRSIPRCPTWRPIQRRSFEPVGQKEPILRQQNAHADVVAPVQPGSQDRGDGVGIFLHDFDGLRVVGHDRNLPRFAFALLSADGQIGAVVLSTTATLFGAPRRSDVPVPGYLSWWACAPARAFSRRGASRLNADGTSLDASGSRDFVYRRAEDLLPEYRTTWLNRPHGGPSGSGFIVSVVPGLAVVI